MRLPLSTMKRRIQTAALGVSLSLLGAATAGVAICSAGRADSGYYPRMAVNGGTLYAQAAPGRYVAVDLNRGAVAWRFVDGALGAFTWPAFSGRSVVVGAGAETGPGTQILSLIEGKVAWRRTFSALVARNSSPVICGVYALAGDPWEGLAQALDVSSGRTKWERGNKKDFFFLPPAVRDSVAFYVVGHHNDTGPVDLVRIDCATGATLDSTPVSGIAWTNYPVLLRGNQAILVSYSAHGRTDIVSFDLPRGMVAWRLHIFAGGRNTPIVEGNDLIFTEDGLCIVGLDSGKILFQKELPFPGGPPAVAGGRLVLQTRKSELSAIDLGSYETVWTASVPGGIVSNIVATGDSVYVRTDTGRLVRVSASDGKALYSIPLE